MSAKIPTHPSNMWETAFVYGFFATFHTCLDQKLFTIEELEESILNTQENSLVSDLCQSLLSILGYQQRKKTLEKALIKFIDERIDTEDCFPRHENPLRSVNAFHELKFHLKVHILKCLCEAQLVENSKIRDYIKVQASLHEEDEGFGITPIGKDSKKRIYWRIGDNCRIYRETRRKRMMGCVWETVAHNLEDLEMLAIGLAENCNRDQENLRRYLVEEMIPSVQADVLRQERKRNRLASLRQEPPALRTRRKRVNYNDDEVMDDLISDRASDTSSQSEPLEVPSTRKVLEHTPYVSTGTRRSKRLNNLSLSNASDSDLNTDMNMI